MKWLRICALLIAVLAGMRAGSWVLGWVLAKLASLRANSVAIAANVVCLAVFVALLVRDLLPEEPIDVLGSIRAGGICDLLLDGFPLASVKDETR